MPQKIISLGAMAALVLAACAAPPSSTPTPSPAPAPSATVLAPTPSPSAAPTAASASAPESAALLMELVNIVNSRLDASSEWAEAFESQSLVQGGGVRTGEESAARIDLASGSIVRLAAESDFQLEALPVAIDNPITRLLLSSGKVFIALSGLLNDETVEVETPVGVASVRGSILGVVLDTETGSVVVGGLEGHCSLTNDAGTQELVEKQQTVAAASDQPPTPPEPLSAQLLKDFSQIPEAQNALTSGNVIVPFLPCLADRNCDTYCAPPAEGAPSPAECESFKDGLAAQGVDFGAFRACYDAGKDIQICANESRTSP